MQTQALSFGSLAITRNPKQKGFLNQFKSETLVFEFKNDNDPSISLDNKQVSADPLFSNGLEELVSSIPRKLTTKSSFWPKSDIFKLLVKYYKLPGIIGHEPTGSFSEEDSYFDFINKNTKFKTGSQDMRQGDMTLEVKSNPKYMTIDMSA